MTENRLFINGGPETRLQDILWAVHDGEKMSVIPYASAIGSIMYAMLCTRPDVNLAVSLVGRYQK